MTATTSSTATNRIDKTPDLLTLALVEKVRFMSEGIVEWEDQIQTEIELMTLQLDRTDC